MIDLLFRPRFPRTPLRLYLSRAVYSVPRSISHARGGAAGPSGLSKPIHRDSSAEEDAPLLLGTMKRAGDNTSVTEIANGLHGVRWKGKTRGGGSIDAEAGFRSRDRAES